ncbi:MAG: DsbA family protein, partial [Pseudomonadota bacterium]
VSGAQIATLGLPPSPEMAALEPSDALSDTIRANPAAALFPGPGSATGILPIAYFTDIRCPICRQVERDLVTLLDEAGDLAMVTHEYPVFGAGSVAAARHILAAAGTGRGEALRQRLQLSAGLTAVHLRRAAEAEGLDPEALARRAMSDDITVQLQTSWALGRLFGFAGTPALVIGRTAILGARPINVLRAVIDAERQA